MFETMVSCFHKQLNDGLLKSIVKTPQNEVGYDREGLQFPRSQMTLANKLL